MISSVHQCTERLENHDQLIILCFKLTIQVQVERAQYLLSVRRFGLFFPHLNSVIELRFASAGISD